MKPSAVILLVLAAVTTLVLVLLGLNEDDTQTLQDISTAPAQTTQDPVTGAPPPALDGNSERTEAPTADGTQGAAEETMDGNLAPYENELVGSVRNEAGDPIPGATVVLSRRPLQAMVFVNDPKVPLHQLLPVRRTKQMQNPC